MGVGRRDPQSLISLPLLELNPGILGRVLFHSLAFPGVGVGPAPFARSGADGEGPRRTQILGEINDLGKIRWWG